MSIAELPPKCGGYGRSIPSVSPELYQALEEYGFSGNIRELQARVRDAVARHEDGMLSLGDFSGITSVQPRFSPAPVTASPSVISGIYSYFGRLPTFREVEDYLVVEAMKISEGNYAVAASTLGVTRQTISNRLKTIGSIS